MILLVDNYDSFTYNLVHFLGELGAATEVVRNDDLDVAGALARQPSAIVISPGPCGPEDAGISVDLVRQAGGRVPILGVCLGHQAVAMAYGARVGRGNVPMHGKVTAIHHDGSGLFAGLPQPLQGTRYHSLVVERRALPASLQITATSQDGTIMGLVHRQHPVYGVQFHPESIDTAHGQRLLANFLAGPHSERSAA